MAALQLLSEPRAVIDASELDVAVLDFDATAQVGDPGGGVAIFGDSVPFIRRLRQAGLRTALASASRSASGVLAVGGMAHLFDGVVEAASAPGPDDFRQAALRQGAEPGRALGVADGVVGVQAFKTAGFGYVIGLARAGSGEDMQRAGADLVVRDLAALEIARRARPRLRAVPAVEALEPPALPTEDPAWLIVEDGFVAAREHEVESLFALANGRLGTRGSLPEGCGMSAPATFAAGLFDAKPGLTPALVVLPDWASLSVSVEDRLLRLESGKVPLHRRSLDLRQAMLWREWRQEDEAGRITRQRAFRFASQADRRLLVQSIELTPENYSGKVRIDTGLGELAVLRTSRGVTAALAGGARIAGTAADRRSSSLAPFEIEVEIGRSYRLDRMVAVCTSRDEPQPERAALAAVRSAEEAGIAALVARHRAAWSERWAKSDIQLSGDPAAQQALRFAAYHLLSAANPEDERVSIAARALSGVVYSGHVFWDTEIFMMPFFVLTWPEAARAMLIYRHHSLPAARAKAVAHGARGAFYAWESADTGEDVTPSFVIAPDGAVIPIPLAAREQHISADVAYAVWHYWRVTGDDRFLLEAGAEIILETARFWASRLELGADGLRHIRGVVGPDEYHEPVDDDAYTNGMAQWNLETGCAVARLLAERWPERWRALSRALGLETSELADWEAAAHGLYTGFDPDTGLIEQFQGYFGLEDIDLQAYEPRNAPMDVVLGRERIAASQVIKQADVVMLLHLLWDRYPPKVRETNFRYYDARCGHGSSLSPSIHAIVAARLGDVALASRYFRQAREIDLADNMGNAAGGIHAGALGGLWQAAVFGFAGLRFDDDGPTVAPNLPPEWQELAFRIQWRGREWPFTVRGRTQ